MSLAFRQLRMIRGCCNFNIQIRNNMKEVKAFVRPSMAAEVYNSLKQNGYCCMSFSECEGTGKYTDPAENFPTLKFPFLHSPMVKMEIVCRNEDAAKVVEIIRRSGSTGRSGDGIIYICNVEEVFKVRNMEKGVNAL